jgi:DNA transposition AAA+ family ATPase
MLRIGLAATPTHLAPGRISPETYESHFDPASEAPDSAQGKSALVGRARGPAYPDGLSDYSARCELVIVDEADRLNTSSIEELRDFYDRSEIGLVLVGMPGLEKRLARYPQFYSRVGFAHAFRPLSQEEARFVLEQHWQGWGGSIRGDEFADQEAVAAVITIIAGNFRLIDRLMSQVRRIKELNQLGTVTREVVDAARDCLVIGTA